MDSVTTAALGTWVTELEEEDVVPTGFVAEENRVRKATILFDLVERKAMMTCWKMAKETWEFVERRKSSTW